ncbi:cellulose biosynthesis protein BcsR [Aeromonas taiwanensis]|uniref:cellulose biosynthesis protein BcsR n=1 Tax=Aeromonas taiwanensis TaxID=633417 RepID=UPI003988EE90
MQNERRQAIQDPFGVPVEGGVVSDVAMVQQAFGVTLSYQDIAFRERLNVLRARFPLLAELDVKGPDASAPGRRA